MGAFVDYMINPFSGLSNTPTTILTTTAHTLCIQRLVVTNLGTQDIRINLKFIRTIDGNESTNTFVVKDFLIPHAKNTIVYNDKIILFNTVNLVEIPSIITTMQYNTDGADLSDAYQIYSSGYTQEFDCHIEYQELNETPLA